MTIVASTLAIFINRYSVRKQSVGTRNRLLVLAIVIITAWVIFRSVLLLISINNGDGKDHLTSVLISSGIVICLSIELYRSKRKEVRVNKKLSTD